jgi:hypothetical protein
LRRRAERDAELTFEIAVSPERAAELTRRALELKRDYRDRRAQVERLTSTRWSEACYDDRSFLAKKAIRRLGAAIGNFAMYVGKRSGFLIAKDASFCTR